MAMDISVWGPHWWASMHAVTYAYPVDSPSDEDKENVVKYFYSVSGVLPCVYCRKHYAEMLRKNPPEEHTENRATLTKWLIDRHNEVNRRLKKREYTYEEVDKMHYVKENADSKNFFYIVGIAVMVILILAILIATGVIIRKRYRKHWD